MCVVLTPSVWAQRSVTELESNMDTDMALQNDTTSKKKPKIVPNDIKAWVIDETYGNMRHVNVDTLMNLFYNDNLSEGRTGHFNSLSNLGSPRHSRIFSERGITPQFMFTEPFDQFFVTTDRFLHYDTKSPYMNVTYTNCGSKQTGDDHVKVIYTNNAGKHFNLGGIFDYMYGQGFYSNQSTSFMNARFIAAATPAPMKGTACAAFRFVMLIPNCLASVLMAMIAASTPNLFSKALSLMRFHVVFAIVTLIICNVATATDFSFTLFEPAADIIPYINCLSALVLHSKP